MFVAESDVRQVQQHGLSTSLALFSRGERGKKDAQVAVGVGKAPLEKTVPAFLLEDRQGGGVARFEGTQKNRAPLNVPCLLYTSPSPRD